MVRYKDWGKKANVQKKTFRKPGVLLLKTTLKQLSGSLAHWKQTIWGGLILLDSTVYDWLNLSHPLTLSVRSKDSPAVHDGQTVGWDFTGRLL